MASLSFVTVSDIDNEFYNRFLKIFREEMGNPDINVDWIASKMGLERSQFYRKIKSLTNYAPVELMRNLRLKQGRILVMTTEKMSVRLHMKQDFLLRRISRNAIVMHLERLHQNQEII